MDIDIFDIAVAGLSVEELDVFLNSVSSTNAYAIDKLYTGTLRVQVLQPHHDAIEITFTPITYPSDVLYAEFNALMIILSSNCKQVGTESLTDEEWIRRVHSYGRQMKYVVACNTDTANSSLSTIDIAMYKAVYVEKYMNNSVQVITQLIQSIFNTSCSPTIRSRSSTAPLCTAE